MAQTTLMPKRRQFLEGIKTSQKSFATTQTTITNLSKLLKERKEKREKISSAILTERRKREYLTLRQESEDELKAKRVVTNPNISSSLGSVAANTGGSFIDRIVNTMGYLAAGWLIRNLPTWEGMAKEFIARLQEAGRIIGSFVTGAIRIFQSSYNLITGAIQNLKNFDLTDSSGNIRTSFDELVDSINDMGSELEAGIKLITTPLTQTAEDGSQVGTYSGEEVPELGSTSTDMGAYADGYATAGLSGVSQQRIGNDVEFLKEVKRVSQKYNIKEGDLLGLIASESGFDPAAGTDHVGLIQFSKDSARVVGTTQSALRRMSRAEQMKYVDKYFEFWKLPKGADAGQLYSVVFAPAYTSKDPNTVLYSSPSAAYRSNAPLDANKDGKITVKEMGARIEGKKKEFGISDNISLSQQQGTTSTGNASASLAQAAQSLKGMSSASGPGGGNLACVWAVNQVFKKAGLKTPWGDSNYAPTAEEQMIKAGYIKIPIGQQKAGDLYIVHGQAHIGIVLANGNIISNSSSGAKFSWEASLSSYQKAYGGAGRFYRIPGGSSTQQTQQSNITSLQRANVTPTESIIKGRRSAYVGSSNVVSTGYKDASGRDIKLNPGAAQAFKQMIADGMPFSSGNVKNVYRDENEYLRLKSQGYEAASNSKHNFGMAADIHGAMNTWIRKNGAKYGWYANDYSRSHGGHFEWRGKANVSSTQAQTTPQPAQTTTQPAQTTTQPAQISSTPAQQSKQQMAQALVPDNKPQDIVAIIPEHQMSPQMPQPSGAPSGGASPSVSMGMLLNNFMKQKLLLDLSYV